MDLDHLAGGRVITVTGVWRYVVIVLLGLLIAFFTIGAFFLEWL